MMHLPSKFLAVFAVVCALVVCVAGRARAQESSSQSSQPPSSSSQSQQAPAPQYGVYVAVDPLAKVRYDNRYDLSVGMAYDHMKAGASLLRGSNLGGLDVEGSYWLTRNWGIQGSGRGYVGTAEPAPNSPNDIKFAMVKQYFFVAGPEWLGPHNKHGAIIAHAMFGGVYGDFQKDLLGQPPAKFDFYSNQLAPAAIIGGHFDLNRSDHWVFRVSPDAVITHYTFNDTTATPQTSYSQFDVNFAISVGAEYKFTSIKRSHKKANWVSGW
ncbi:MAG: hypothetical protein ACLQG3_03005 [Terracidiphilus sp.]